MRTVVVLFFVCLLILLPATLSAQVTNLRFNGASANFSFVQGDSVWWEYNVPTGGTASGEIWVDLNQNGSIDPGTDKSLFGSFTQTDGDAAGNNGPGDMDGVANGHVIFTLGEFGLAPAKYILRFTCNSQSASISGTCTVMPSPAFTISGHVTTPSGVSNQNIVIESGTQDRGGPGYLALTNASGNYVINLKASAGGKNWYIMVLDQIPPYTTPATQGVLLNSSVSGINFEFGVASAQIVGYLKGEDGHALSGVHISAYPYSLYGGSNGDGVDATTDATGFFKLGFSMSDLNSSPTWKIQASSDGVAPEYFPPVSGVVSLHQYDSLEVDLTAFFADDSITGMVTLDGVAPGNVSIDVWAGTQDSGNTNASSQPFTGAFNLHVSKKIGTYYVGANSPDGYTLPNGSMQQHAGDKNVTLNLVKLEWKQQTSSTSQPLYAVSFVDNLQGWAAGANGTLIHTSNGGDSWSSQTTNSTSNLRSVWFINGTTGWFGGDDGVLKKTTNGGTSWSSQNSGTAAQLKCMQFVDANTGWIGLASNPGNTNILKTTNGGSTWTGVASGYGDVQSIFFLNATTGWAVANGTTVLKSTDGGSSWTNFSNPPGCTLRTIRFTTADIGWAGGDCGTILKTTNGGVDWTSQANGGCGVQSIFPLSSATVWAVGECSMISKTTDGGGTWNSLNNIVNGNLHALAFRPDGSGWAVGDYGIIIHKIGHNTAISCDIPTLAGWNMVSVPLTIADCRKTVLFPAAISSAYSYSTAGGYASRDTLRNKVGYWLKYAAPAIENLQGEYRHTDSIAVTVGWNLIGSIGREIEKSSVIQSSPGMIQSPFYIFAGGYAASDTVKPGRAYWVKCSQAGWLILTSVVPAAPPAAMVPVPSRVSAVAPKGMFLSRRFGLR